MRLFKQLVFVFFALGILVSVLMIFTYDVIKIDWVVFMEIQDSYGTQEKPLQVPARSIPIEGPAYVPGAGAPANPVPADEASLARGVQLFGIHCQMCHGEAGQGNGPIAAFLVQKKPADLSGALVQDKDDGTLFLTISNGFGLMPPLNGNLTVRERWDVVNYIRTLKAAEGQ
ncbi:MAG: cytochrome c [Anaerolineales bacterium]|nr:MAG: cytochrome c [Anaerolineales bacterium]